MKRYQVTIHLSTGDNIDAKVTARNQADALRRLQSTPQVAQFIAEQRATIESVKVEPIPIEPIDNQRYALTNAVNKPGWLVLADLDNRFRIEFKRGRWNDTQRVLPLSGDKLPAIPADKMATALREAADYMIENFENLI
jgi:hypothetical protein